MGCAESRSYQEQLTTLLDKAERKLQYHNKNSEEIEKTFKKQSYSQDINENQLSKILEDAKLAQLPGEWFFKVKQKDKIWIFYQHLSQDKKSYNLRDLILTAILLSQGSPEIKAEQIYMNLDTQLQGYVDIKQIEFFSNLADNLVTDWLVYLAQGDDLEDGTQLTQEACKKMVKQWSKLNLKDMLQQQILQKREKLSKKEFIKAICLGQYNLTSTTSIREIQFYLADQEKRRQQSLNQH